MIDFSNIIEVLLGVDDVLKIEDSNSVILWQKPQPVTANYFYVEDLSGSNNTLSIYSANSNAPSIEVFASTDSTNWNSMGTTSTTPIRATVPANSKLYLKATANTWTTTDSNADNCNHINCLGDYAIGGNIMSLLVGDNYQNATLNTNYTQQFKDVFSELSTGYRTLIDASQLVLPTNVTEECYYKMFESCLNLTAAPALPATTLANDCYRLMFVTCTSLTAAPALPATTLANRCYYQMFEGCTALTSAPATLPATNTASYCCFRMFASCSALTTAPTLHATTLAANCYRQMFDGCSSLNSVTTYANTKDNLNPPLSNWLQNVAATGDFYNLGQLTYIADSASGIPSGWTEHHSLPIPCNVSISAGSNGSISVNGVPGNYSATVMSDTQLSLVATPAAGYQFDSWSDGDTNATRTITVTGDLTLTASFAQAVVANYFYVEDISGANNTLSIVKSNVGASTVEPYYSTDGTNWTSMGTTDTTAITATIPANGKLYLKCNTNSWGNQNNSYANYITASGDHNVGGNIMSLLYDDNFENTTLDSNYVRQFMSLFYNNTHLIDASDLILPTNTTSICYFSMFSGCTSLTTAPALPATTLAESCYGSMFWGCSSLPTAPALPATTLANYCYANMFSGCTSLTTAPATLPATTLADYCCQRMFEGCTSLTTTPTLPATTLATYCYASMFSGCTSLTTAPALPATTLPTYCYANMFSGCTSLTTAPATLPATTLADYCCQRMFEGCTSLTSAPALPATTLTNDCYRYMFSGCTSLTTTPTLPATTLATYCYASMFSGCTSLTTAPALPATTLVDNCYVSMFSGCTSLTTAPALPATTLANYCYDNMFRGCTALTTAPSLPATTLIDYCYRSMFYGCTALTTAPALPATTLDYWCYASMFSGCTSLTTAPALPATTLAKSCYRNMFQNCTLLTSAPALPATTLTNDCYRYMFYRCSSLNRVEIYADSISATDCLSNWLSGVSTTGDFYNLGTATYSSGASGIPSGWTEHTSL